MPPPRGAFSSIATCIKFCAMDFAVSLAGTGRIALQLDLFAVFFVQRTQEPKRVSHRAKRVKTISEGGMELMIVQETAIQLTSLQPLLPN